MTILVHRRLQSDVVVGGFAGERNIYIPQVQVAGPNSE